MKVLLWSSGNNWHVETVKDLIKENYSLLKVINIKDGT
jgi:hypothetical protein